METIVDVALRIAKAALEDVEYLTVLEMSELSDDDARAALDIIHNLKVAL